MKDGANDFLTKPFQRAQLIKVVRQALERRDLIAQNRALQKRLDDLLRQGNMIGASPAFRRHDDAGAAGGGQLGHRADPGRERHRQGAGGARHPRPLEPPQRAVRRGQLRGAARDAARVRAVRPREGRVHRGGRAQGGPLRAGRRRHALPRRDRRPLAGDPGQAPARAAGGRVRARGRHPDDPGGRAHRRRHQPGPGRRSCGTSASARTSSTASTSSPIQVPPLRERREDMPLLAQHFLRVYAAKNNRQLDGFSDEALGCLEAYSLAGQRARARERGRARGGAGPRRPRGGGRSARRGARSARSC